MRKYYITPTILPLTALSEGRCRSLLAALLLTPCTPRLAAAAREAYFDLELRCIDENCRRHLRGVPLQPYRIQPLALLQNLLAAAAVPLHAAGCRFQYTVSGDAGEAIAYPRPLQWATALLLRCVCCAPAAYATGSVEQAHCTLTITGAAVVTDTLTDLATTVLAAHGGCVLHTHNAIGFRFPRRQKAAAPPWFTPCNDSLLNDPLSCISFLRTAPPPAVPNYP